MKDARERAHTAIGEAASEWVVLLAGDAATAADKAAFMEWLRQSPLHVQQYLKAEVAFLALQGAAGIDSTDVKALLAQEPSNIVELASAAPADTVRAQTGVLPGEATRRRGRRFVSAAAVLLLGCAALFSSGVVERLRSDVYATATGEQRRIVLADGSTIDLNTQTRLRVKFTGATRGIELTKGEAYFTVAKDLARPFTVTANHREIRALGTAFIVRGDDRQFSVTLIEGKVTVAPLDPVPAGASKAHDEITSRSVAPLALIPGQRVTFVFSGEDARVDSPAIEKVTAWRERRLIFEDQPIAEVAAEFNRYNTRQIIIEDADLAEERINGVFDADKPRNLVDFLIRNTGARVEEHPDRLAVTKASSPR